jgi:hypothetical protein
MSLFGNLFGDSLETHVFKEFTAYKNAIDEIIRWQNAVLESHGIKPPRIISELSYDLEAGKEKNLYVSVIPPRFEIPPHKQFIIRRNKIVITFFDNLERWEEVYPWWGLVSVVNNRSFGDVWTNRDPFALYRMLQETEHKNLSVMREGDLTLRLRNCENATKKTQQIPLLNSVPRMSDEEAMAVHLRVQLFNKVTGGQKEYLRDPLKYYEPHYTAAESLSDDFLFCLPIAPPWFTAETSDIKVLPSGEIKAGRIIEFLNSLRSLDQYISLELVRGETESVSFRMRYPEECGHEILAKLKLYFPDFEVLEAETSDEPVQYSISWLNKPRTYNPISQLGEFQIDPYAHFAKLFDNTPPGQFLCYQIVFAPLSDAAAVMLKDELRYSDYSKTSLKNSPYG